MIFWKHLDKGWMPLPFTTCFLAVKENGSVTFTVGFWNGEAFEVVAQPRDEFSQTCIFHAPVGQHACDGWEDVEWPGHGASSTIG